MARWRSRPPRLESVDAIRANRSQRRRPEPRNVENLRGPDAGQDVGHAPESASHPPPIGKHTGQVSALDVIGAHRFLDIREPRPVLDVQLRPTSRIPGEDIGAAGELVVLERLVDRHLNSFGRHPSREDLAHRRVNRIVGSHRVGTHSRVGEVKSKVETQCGGDCRVARERRRSTVLDCVHRRNREAAALRQVPKRPVSRPPCVADDDAEMACEAERFPTSRRRRHSLGSEQDRPFLASNHRFAHRHSTPPLNPRRGPSVRDTDGERLGAQSDPRTAAIVR